jgi:hypothetical protein
MGSVPLCQSADWSKPLALAWQAWESMGVVHTTEPMPTTTAADTITITIPADLAWRLKSACADSAGIWHQHWRDVADGKRDDLNRDACASISRNAWQLWEILDSQGV